MSNTWVSQVGSLQLGAKRIERNQRELIGGKLGNQRERPSKRTNLKKKKPKACSKPICYLALPANQILKETIC